MEVDGRTAHDRYYPIFVSMKGRICLVVGGGAVAERKAKGLLLAGASVRVAAPEKTEWLRKACEEGNISCVADRFTDRCLDGVDLVFAASNDPLLNREIASETRRRRIWCNMATDPEEGSFILPAVFQRGHLTIAVSTSGSSPAAARQIRRKLEDEFDDAWIIYLEMMAILRGVIQSKKLNSVQNQELFQEVVELPLVEWVRRREKDAVVDAVCSVCHPFLSHDEMSEIWDGAWRAFSSS